MLTQDQLRALRTEAQVEAEIEKRRTQMRGMAGWLYPSIVADEIVQLANRRREIATQTP